MVGSDQVATLMITSEPLVEVAVRQFRDRAARFILQFRSQVWCSSDETMSPSPQNKQTEHQRAFRFSASVLKVSCLAAARGDRAILLRRPMRPVSLGAEEAELDLHPHPQTRPKVAVILSVVGTCWRLKR